MVVVKRLTVGLCFLLLTATSLFATEEGAYEYRAVNLGKDEKAATAKLNDLMSEGWEIHGVVGNNLTAFRRKSKHKAEAKPEVKKEEPKKVEPKKEEPKKEEPKKVEPKKEEPKKEEAKPEKPKDEPKPSKEEPKPEAVKVVEKPVEKPLDKPKPADEAPEVPAMMPIIDKIAASVTSDPKNAPSPKLEEAKTPAAMMPEVKTIERPATKPMDQVASATPASERSVLKSGTPEELPATIARIPAAGEVDSLQGTWSLVVYVLNGRQVRTDDARSTWTVEGDRWTSRWVNDAGVVQVASGTMRYVENRNGVKSVDLLHTDGLYKGKATYSIYQIEGDVLKYCYSASPENRPATFATSEGDGVGLVMWRKMK